MSEKSLIEDKLRSIFEKALSPIDIFDNKAKLEMEILGDELGFKSRHLLIIYYAVEKEFEIKISEKVVLEGKFNTFNNILQCIYQEKGIYEQNVNCCY
jgi:peptide maturation system acyl carrier-related protein